VDPNNRLQRIAIKPDFLLNSEWHRLPSTRVDSQRGEFLRSGKCKPFRIVLRRDATDLVPRIRWWMLNYQWCVVKNQASVFWACDQGDFYWSSETSVVTSVTGEAGYPALIPKFVTTIWATNINFCCNSIAKKQYIAYCQRIIRLRLSDNGKTDCIVESGVWSLLHHFIKLDEAIVSSFSTC